MTASPSAEPRPTSSAALLPEEDFRYEVKFVLQRRAQCAVEARIKLHPAGFRRTYPPRYVNNIYLDSWNLSHYNDNLAGVANRQKIRIRWYGPPRADDMPAVLEWKTRAGRVGRKRRFALDALRIQNGANVPAVRRALATCRLPDDLRSEVASLRPVLLNRYHRQYFESLDRRLRLTVDREMRFSAIAFDSDQPAASWRQDGDEILEIKYAVAHADLAARATQRFPFRLGRHSKYARGISLTNVDARELYSP